MPPGIRVGTPGSFPGEAPSQSWGVKRAFPSRSWGTRIKNKGGGRGGPRHRPPSASRREHRRDTWPPGKSPLTPLLGEGGDEWPGAAIEGGHTGVRLGNQRLGGGAADPSWPRRFTTGGLGR